VVFIDGACKHNRCNIARRPGIGAFWGEAKNVSEPLSGTIQTNQRAELEAAIRVVRTESRPVEIRSDSQYVVHGCTKNLPRWKRAAWRRGRRDISNRDLWECMALLLRNRSPGEVSFKKVWGHASARDVSNGIVEAIDKEGNEAADALAVAGAAAHQASPELVEELRW
jgi:ribonuclease HI